MPANPSFSPRWILVTILVALTLWGIFHAVGAAVHGREPRAGLVVLASFVLFLGIWLLLLAIRHRKEGKSLDD